MAFWPARLHPPDTTEQGADREGVPQVVKPWRAVTIGSDAGVVDKLAEGLANHSVADPVAGQRDEEARHLRSRLQLVAQPGVIRECLHGAGLQGNQPGLAELGLPDQQHTIGPVDVGAVFTWLKPDRELDHDAIGVMVAELFFGGVKSVQLPSALAKVKAGRGAARKAGAGPAHPLTR